MSYTCIKLPYKTEEIAKSLAREEDHVYYCFYHEGYHIKRKVGSRHKGDEIPKKTVAELTADGQ